MADQPRRIDASHGLLDLQVVDRDARPVGKVEDLELDDTGSGAPAFGDRLGGRLGGWYKAVHRRLHDEKSPRPARITFDQVRHINSKVDLTISQDELDIGRLEEWLVDHLIRRIPGADHAPPQ